MNLPTAQPEIFEFSIADLPRGIEGAFGDLTSLPNAIFLDGCADKIQITHLNRYSFLAADPIDSLVVDNPRDFDFATLRSWAGSFAGKIVTDLPPFQGGVAGMFSYEFNSAIENIAPAKIDEFAVPQTALYAYDTVVAIDHGRQTGWIIAQPWTHDPSARLKQFKSLLFSPVAQKPIARSETPIIPGASMNRIDGELELYSDFSEQEYLNMIHRAVEYIRAGDIFQVNLSQRLLAPATTPSPELYLRMRNANAAPFSGYLDFSCGQLISASPERLIKCNDGNIETRPIKGTRRRTNYPEVDLNVQNELVANEKDRAENIMIVDLMRNDLSRFSDPDSVRVSQLCGVEQYRNVLHLVSVVQAKLASNRDIIDVFESVFPGGSITGAPKIRAMEIIAELEPTARGPYCGSLGYFNFDGNADFNILIRSVTAKGGWWQIPVGGGIVADSVPEKEYEETWTKAIGMLQAIKSPVRKQPTESVAAQ